MWLYEKLITLDDKHIILNSGSGFSKMKNAFKGVKEKSPIPTKCGYGPIQVRFSSDEKEVVTYPGIDECAMAALDSAEEGPFFYLGEEPTDYLWSLIKKYELREKWEETRQ